MQKEYNYTKDRIKKWTVVLSDPYAYYMLRSYDSLKVFSTDFLVFSLSELFLSCPYFQIMEHRNLMQPHEFCPFPEYHR